jgi:DNA polymerase III alpha subunit
LKEISLEFINSLLREREGGSFVDFFDFVCRLNPSFSEIRILIRSGSIDCVGGGLTRPQLFWVFFHMAKERTLFAAPQVPGCIGDYSGAAKIQDEVRTLDVLISCHPLEAASFLSPPCRGVRLPLMIDSRSIASCVHLRVCIAGFLVAGKEVRTKNRQYMSFVSFDDPYSLFETVVFPDRYRELSLKMEGGIMFIVVGTIRVDEGAYTLEVENLIPLSGKKGEESIELKYERQDENCGEYIGEYRRSPIRNLLGHSRQLASYRS